MPKTQMMNPDDELCNNTITWVKDALENHSWLWYTYLFLWILGILGNLADIIVFTHERMIKSYIISLLYWLAVCDFLQLFSFFALSFHYNFNFYEILRLYLDLINGTHSQQDLNLGEKPEFYATLFIFSPHNISLILNITLVSVQYLMVVYPFRYKRLFSGNHSKKWLGYGILFVGTIASSFFLISVVHKSDPLHVKVQIKFDKSGNAYVEGKLDGGDVSNAHEVINSMYEDAMERRDDILKEMFSIDLENDEDFRRLSGEKFNRTAFLNYNKTTLVKWIDENIEAKFIPNPYLNISLKYAHFGSWTNSAFVTILSSITVRTGLLVLLIIAIIGLILGSLRARRIQHRVQGSVSEVTDKVTNRMTNMALVVVCIFSITEVPILAYSYFRLPVNSLQIETMYFGVFRSTNNFGICDCLSTNCCNSLASIVTVFMLLSLLFSCTYTTFCYLLMSTQYRDILMYVLCNIFRTFMRDSHSSTQCTLTEETHHQAHPTSNSP